MNRVMADAYLQGGLRGKEDECPSAAMHKKQEWELQWQKLDTESRLLGRFLRLCRITMVAREVAAQIEKHFPARGMFVEAGCGSSEDSIKVTPRERKLVGMDFSEQALATAKERGSMHQLLCGDMGNFPLAQNSVDGMWNVGVMEHFPRPVLEEVLEECARVLKPGGKCVFFWPWNLGPSTIILESINWIRKKILGKKENLYITEHSRLWSKRHAIGIINPIFGKCRAQYSWRTGLVFLIVVAEKQPKRAAP